MLSRSLSECQSLTLIVMVWASQFVKNNQLCHSVTKSLSMSLSLFSCWSCHISSSFWETSHVSIKTTLQCSVNVESNKFTYSTNKRVTISFIELSYTARNIAHVNLIILTSLWTVLCIAGDLLCQVNWASRWDARCSAINGVSFFLSVEMKRHKGYKQSK